MPWRPRLRLRPLGNPAARAVTETVERATTKDTHGRERTDRKQIVAPVRSDRNKIRSSCPPVCELAASGRREQASELSHLRQPPASGGVVGGRGLVAKIGFYPPDYEVGVSLDETASAAPGGAAPAGPINPENGWTRRRRGFLRRPEGLARASWDVSFVGVVRDILELQGKSRAAAVRQRSVRRADEPAGDRLGGRHDDLASEQFRTVLG
jgi:hypothetical protein